ncbi:hypothetical protein [Ralstonia solanacearum]|uniref:hypothetical protein n=1 Tax=Ralstonia solanacearum TaxID=305 RepID=UPI001F14F04E|nr:hypothetical protein [Ralstonia solanacearum]
MTVGKTGTRQREATVLDRAEFQADNLADFVRQCVPRGKRLSIWLSGGHCHYVAFPRPRWVFAAGKLHTIAARVFEQKTMQNAADYRLSLKPSRSSLHVCARGGAWSGMGGGQRWLGNSRSIGQCVLMNGDLMTM